MKLKILLWLPKKLMLHSNKLPLLFNAISDNLKARTLVQNLQQEREFSATTIQGIQRGISVRQQFKKLK